MSIKKKNQNQNLIRKLNYLKKGNTMSPEDIFNKILQSIKDTGRSISTKYESHIRKKNTRSK